MKSANNDILQRLQARWTSYNVTRRNDTYYFQQVRRREDGQWEYRTMGRKDGLTTFSSASNLSAAEGEARWNRIGKAYL
jgi:hypothetical protein